MQWKLLFRILDGGCYRVALPEPQNLGMPPAEMIKSSLLCHNLTGSVQWTMYVCLDVLTSDWQRPFQAPL
jgi:hypothetical protein